MRFENRTEDVLSINRLTNTGFLGVVTRPGDMPVSGAASYAGEAEGGVFERVFTRPGDEWVLTETQQVALSGAATVTADFSAGRVDVAMTTLGATDPATGAAVTSPVDQPR